MSTCSLVMSPSHDKYYFTKKLLCPGKRKKVKTTNDMMVVNEKALRRQQLTHKKTHKA